MAGPVIGDKLGPIIPPYPNGKPERNQNFRPQDTFNRVVLQVLENGIPPPSALADPATGGALTLTGALTIGEADLHHGPRTLLIHGYALRQLQNNATYSGGAWWLDSGLSGSFSSPTASTAAAAGAVIPLTIGDRIQSLVMQLKGTVAGTMAFKAWKMTSTATHTQIGGTQTSTAAATDQTLTISGLTETVVDNTYYYLEVTPSAVGVGSVYGFKVIYDRP